MKTNYSLFLPGLYRQLKNLWNQLKSSSMTSDRVFVPFWFNFSPVFIQSAAASDCVLIHYSCSQLLYDYLLQSIHKTVVINQEDDHKNAVIGFGFMRLIDIFKCIKLCRMWKRTDANLPPVRQEVLKGVEVIFRGWRLSTRDKWGQEAYLRSAYGSFCILW